MSTDHVKLTREQREAAGWTRCWGLYDWNDGRWKLSPRGDANLVDTGWCAIGTGRTHDFATSIAASQYAEEHAARNGIAPKPFWRRVRPKPAKPTGEAIVRVTLADAVAKSEQGLLYCHGVKSGCGYWLKPEDIEREVDR